jgi:DNA-binding transcriptional LysR family regulator
MLDWNDLHHLYALAKHGSLPGAAEAINVNRTTVARRINQLETALGTKLVERMGRDLVLTDAGREAAASAEIIDGEFQSLQRRVFGRDQQLAGAIRVTVTPAIGNLIARQLAQFTALHPEILLEVSATNAAEDLEMMEADVALRLTSKPPENLVGRKLLKPMVGIYASADAAEDVQTQTVVDVVSLQSATGNKLFSSDSMTTWLETTLNARSQAALHSNSTDFIREYVAASKAVAVLPCYVAEADQRLTRIGEPRAEGFTELWLLYHPRLRRLQRFRAFTSYLTDEFEKLRPVFEGEPKPPSSPATP